MKYFLVALKICLFLLVGPVYGSIPSPDLTFSLLQHKHFSPDHDISPVQSKRVLPEPHPFINFEDLRPNEQRALLETLKVTHIIYKRDNGEHCYVNPQNDPDLVPSFTEVTTQAPFDLSPSLPLCDENEIYAIQEIAARSVLEHTKIAAIQFAVGVTAFLAGSVIGCGLELLPSEIAKGKTFQNVAGVAGGLAIISAASRTEGILTPSVPVNLMKGLGYFALTNVGVTTGSFVCENVSYLVDMF